MSRIMIFQHVSAEPLGVLDPLIRARGHRMRFYNFHRHPGANPKVDRYDGLIVLGGPMNVDQMDDYPHLAVEAEAIRRAVEAGKPVLGICLGAQLLAHAFGATVGPAPQWEIGWYPLATTAAGDADPVVQALGPETTLFEWHGQTFTMPEGAERLMTGTQCENQAFRLGENAYGFQFHLEVDEHLVNRWLTIKGYKRELEDSDAGTTVARVADETRHHMAGSRTVAREVFDAFLDQVAPAKTRVTLPSR
ncbi:MAG: type 1 glutamine amidotransferase [Pseudomonadota bacterium]